MSARHFLKCLESPDANCLCPECPTNGHQTVANTGTDYCFLTGRVKTISKDERGCLCGVCPKYALEKFITIYFCTQGIELTQSFLRLTF